MTTPETSLSLEQLLVSLKREAGSRDKGLPPVDKWNPAKGIAKLALELKQDLRNFSNLTLVSLDENLADFASEVAANHRLRGTDAIYAAVALRFGSELVTLDKEQLERLPKVLPVRAP